MENYVGEGVLSQPNAHILSYIQNFLIMPQKFGPRGEALLRNLIAGLNEAKKKWQVRYEAAVTEYEQLTALQHMNQCAEEAAAYTRMLKGGVRL